MRKFHYLLLFFLLLMNLSSAPAQDVKAQPKLLGSFFKGDSYEFLYNMSSTIPDYTKNDEHIVIRICSKDNISWALATAAGNPFQIVERLKKFQISEDRIFFARYSQCSLQSDKARVVEFWVAPPNSTLAADEIAPAANIEVKISPIAANKSQFEKILDSAVKTLKTDAKYKVYLVGYYNRKPSKRLKNKVVETRSYLIKNKIRRSISAARILQWSEIPYYEREPAYPVIVLIAIPGNK